MKQILLRIWMVGWVVVGVCATGLAMVSGFVSVSVELAAHRANRAANETPFSTELSRKDIVEIFGLLSVEQQTEAKKLKKNGRTSSAALHLVLFGDTRTSSKMPPEEADTILNLLSETQKWQIELLIDDGMSGSQAIRRVQGAAFVSTHIEKTKQASYWSISSIALSCLVAVLAGAASIAACKFLFWLGLWIFTGKNRWKDAMNGAG